MPKVKSKFVFVLMFLLFILGLGLFAILYISIKYVPVHNENMLMGEYKFVDKNYNEIVEKTDEFNKFFDVSFAFNLLSNDVVSPPNKASKKQEVFTHGFFLGSDNNFSFHITQKDTKTKVKADKIEVLLTRYETNSLNEQLTNITNTDNNYLVSKININRSGRWKIILRLTIGDKTGIFEQGIFAK